MARADWKTPTLKTGDYIFKLMPKDGYMMVQHVDRTIDPYLARAENYETGQTHDALHATLASARQHCERIST